MTIKLTRHTAAPFQSHPHCHPERSIKFAIAKLMRSRGTLRLILNSATTRRFNSMGLVACSSRAQRLSVLSHPSRLISGTHKNLQRLVICPIYSVVKYRPRWLLQINESPSKPRTRRVWVLLIPESCKLQNPSNPMFDANNVDAQHQVESSNGQNRALPNHGGADRDRTGGLLVANQALSQLSYSPNPVVCL